MARLAKLVIPVSAAALLLAGCAAAPDATPSGSASASAYCARMVTDSGGLEDHSFNQASWGGMQDAQQQYGIDVQPYVSRSDDDLAPNVEQAADSGCQFVLTVGWSLAEATQDQAEAHPGTHFAIVDDNSIDLPNVKPIVFDTAEASYLAGYLAAGMSKTGKVATFGGAPDPAVMLFMDGFVDGVAKYNEVHGTSVQALGWDKAAQNGTTNSGYEDVSLGKTISEGFIAQGADVILPVAGQVGEGAAQAALEHPGTLVIWVDTDGYDVAGMDRYRSVLLTSVMKNAGDAVSAIIGDDIDGKYTNEPFIGTLANGGVGIAPYHDLAASVDPTLAGEVQDLTQQIIDGKIVVTSPSSPINKG